MAGLGPHNLMKLVTGDQCYKLSKKGNFWIV